MFEGYSSDDRVSVKELTVMFLKRPLQLSPPESLLWARYLLEPRDQPEIESSPYIDRPLSELKDALDASLGISYLYNAANAEETKAHTLKAVAMANSCRSSSRR